MFRVCTAKELGDHCKEMHRSNMDYERKPYRCGLCDNRWKVSFPRFLVIANARADNLGAEFERTYVSSPSVCFLIVCSPVDVLAYSLMVRFYSSRAHFQDAITHLTPSSAVDIDSPAADDNAVVTVRPPSAPAPGREKDSGKTLKAKKKYQCPKCSKVYKQLSGLRYHESHVSTHTSNYPTSVLPLLRFSNI